MLMTIQEARDTLRVDSNDNDEIIEALLDAIPSYMEVATGTNWDNDEYETHPLAKTTAKFILQLWFDPQDSERLKRTIDSLLTTLTVIGNGSKV